MKAVLKCLYAILGGAKRRMWVFIKSPQFVRDFSKIKAYSEGKKEELRNIPQHNRYNPENTHLMEDIE